MSSVCLSKCVVSLLLLLNAIYAHLITFELQESQLNEVVFIGDYVVLQCTITGVTRVVNMSILRAGSTVAEREQDLFYVQHIIANASTNDIGNYICIVTYGDTISVPTETVNDTFFLDVREERPQCLHNGTDPTSYQVGDVLTITCYCFKEDLCQWIQTIEGSAVGSIITSTTTKYNNKRIQRAIVGPLSAMDDNIRFSCSYGSAVSQRCNIGPLTHRSTETNYNYSSTIETTRIYVSLSTTSFIDNTSFAYSKRPKVGILGNAPENFIPWLILGVTFVTAILLTSLLFICVLVKRKWSYDLKDTEKETTTARYTYSNSTYRSDHDEGKLTTSSSINNICQEVPIQDFIVSYSIKGDYAEVNETKIQGSSPIKQQKAPPSLPLSKPLRVSQSHAQPGEEALYAKIDKRRQKKYCNHFGNSSSNVKNVTRVTPTTQINRDTESLHTGQDVKRSEESELKKVSNFHAEPKTEDLYAKVNKGRHKKSTHHLGDQISDILDRRQARVLDDSDIYAEIT